MKPTTLHHINVNVPNLKEAVEFYTKTLNFEVTGEYTNGKMDFVFVSNGRDTYELIENADIKVATFDHIAFESKDIYADYEYFKGLENNPLLGEVSFLDFLFEKGVSIFFIQGPGGERIEFCQIKE